jgi:hypothetical protein
VSFQTRVTIVVEGAKGLTLDCNTDGGEGNLTRSTVKTTSMSEWNERVEVEYTWRPELQYISLTHLSCVLKDKNGQFPFDYTIWQVYLDNFTNQINKFHIFSNFIFLSKWLQFIKLQ